MVAEILLVLNSFSYVRIHLTNLYRTKLHFVHIIEVYV